MNDAPIGSDNLYVSGIIIYKSNLKLDLLYEQVLTSSVQYFPPYYYDPKATRLNI